MRDDGATDRQEDAVKIPDPLRLWWYEEFLAATSSNGCADQCSDAEKGEIPTRMRMSRSTGVIAIFATVDTDDETSCAAS